MTFYLNEVEDTRTHPVYFIGDSDVPYVSLKDWGELYTYLMKNVIEDEHISFTLTYSQEGETGILTREDGYTMTVDCAADTITFYDYDAFLQPEADRILIDVLDEDTAHTAHTGEKKSLFHRTTSAYERYGDQVVLDAGTYDIDFVSDSNGVYMPIQTLSDFTLAIKYMNVFYNGEAIFFVAFNGLEDTELGKLFYEVEPRDRSEAMGSSALTNSVLCLITSMV